MANGPAKEEIAEIFKSLKNAHRANKARITRLPGMLRLRGQESDVGKCHICYLHLSGLFLGPPQYGRSYHVCALYQPGFVVVGSTSPNEGRRKRRRS